VPRSSLNTTRESASQKASRHLTGIRRSGAVKALVQARMTSSGTSRLPIISPDGLPETAASVGIPAEEPSDVFAAQRF
jgi:hypothetical protein